MHPRLEPQAQKGTFPPGKTLAVCAILVGLWGGLGTAAGEPLEIVVSVPPQAYFVERIGGEQVRVQVMIPAGASPETYSPTPRQRSALEHARAYVRVGHPHFVFERIHIAPYLEAHPGLAVVDMMPPLSGREATAGRLAEAKRAGDPHVWLSPAVVAAAAVEIERTLEALAPERGGEFRANLAAFLADLEALDAAIRESLAAVPTDPGRRSFLVVHPAWGWLAGEYGLEQIAIEADGKEPGPRELIPLLERARASRLQVIFVQPGFSQRRAALIAGEIGAEVVELDPLARDWLGNMYRVAAALGDALKEGDGVGSGDDG